MELVHGGEDYFSRLEKLIADAQHEIHFQTYIYASDATGERITKALTEATRRGVEVYVIMDAYGSKEIDKKITDEFKAAGIKFRFFGSVGSNQWLAWGRRLHHKIIVADRAHALVGGINVSDDYSGMGGHPAWLDYALLVNGPACQNIFKICQQVYSQWFTIKQRRFKSFEKKTPGKKKVTIQLRFNDWLRGRNQIARSYIQAINSAKKEIIIVNSYFLPGTFFRQALRRAAQRGVKIKIVLPGVSDIPMIREATAYLYDFLMRYNMEIYEWQPSVLHAKVACVDGEWSTVGSYNLNYLSAYGSLEFNINVLDAEFGGTFMNEMHRIMETGCKKIDNQVYLKDISVFKRLRNWFSYQVMKVSSALLVTFPGQRFFDKNRYA